MQETLKIGIAPYSEMKAHSIALAEGSHDRSKDDPTVWFASLESLATVLSARNTALLRLIAEQKPESLAALERISGYEKSDLCLTLRSMERYGVVQLTKGVDGEMMPHVPYRRIQFELALNGPNVDT